MCRCANLGLRTFFSCFMKRMSNRILASTSTKPVSTKPVTLSIGKSCSLCVLFLLTVPVLVIVSYLTTQVTDITHTIADMKHTITEIQIHTAPLPHVPAACLEYNLQLSSYEPDDDCCAVFGSCAEGYEFSMANPCAVIAVGSDTHTAYKTVCVAT